MVFMVFVQQGPKIRTELCAHPFNRPTPPQGWTVAGAIVLVHLTLMSNCFSAELFNKIIKKHSNEVQDVQTLFLFI